jgi:hypothetical protein
MSSASTRRDVRVPPSTSPRDVICRDISDALYRLRIYRVSGTRHQVAVAQRRLDWLLDRLCLITHKEGEGKPT